jgi:U3 small nucleolar RNA-associated protein 13
MKMLTSFQEQGSIESIYTGGSVRVSKSSLYTTQESKIIITSLETQATDCLSFDTAITCFQIIPPFVIVGLQQRLQIFENDLLKTTLKLHEAPILVMDVWKGFCATGSADSTVKVIDVLKGFCTHSFKGHAGVVSALAFAENGLLASGSDDCSVRVWDLFTKR